MPTPSGKLKAGDRLIHTENRGTGEWEVVRRDGNDAIYSVVLTRADGGPLPVGVRPSFGDDPGTFRLTEAHYWVFMARGGWTLVSR
jgi:hypothetical protein